MLFLAIAALFLASDASRKAERQIQSFLATYLTPIKKSNAKDIATIKDVLAMIKTPESALEAIRETQTETSERLTRQDNEIRKPREALAKLDRIIPAQLKRDSDGPARPKRPPQPPSRLRRASISAAAASRSDMWNPFATSGLTPARTRRAWSA